MEEISERFNAVNGEFLKFNRIPEGDRKHPRPDLCAMLYLHDKFGGKGDMVSSAEHDEIWLDVSCKNVASLSNDDIVYLVRCGVRCSDGSLAMFA